MKKFLTALVFLVMACGSSALAEERPHAVFKGVVADVQFFAAFPPRSTGTDDYCVPLGFTIVRMNDGRVRIFRGVPITEFAIGQKNVIVYYTASGGICPYRYEKGQIESVVVERDAEARPQKK